MSINSRSAIYSNDDGVLTQIAQQAESSQLNVKVN